MFFTNVNSWINLLQDGNSVDIAYFDFHKAFDSVPHERLLSTLLSYGIEEEIHGWLHEFITSRAQRVVLNDKLSEWTTMQSGVPQGSVLGPLLFLLFVNDISSFTSNSLLLFADDIKLSSQICNYNDQMQFQQDIDSLIQCSELWQLSLTQINVLYYTLG